MFFLTHRQVDGTTKRKYNFIGILITLYTWKVMTFFAVDLYLCFVFTLHCDAARSCELKFIIIKGVKFSTG